MGGMLPGVGPPAFKAFAAGPADLDWPQTGSHRCPCPRFCDLTDVVLVVVDLAMPSPLPFSPKPASLRPTRRSRVRMASFLFSSKESTTALSWSTGWARRCCARASPRNHSRAGGWCTHSWRQPWLCAPPGRTTQSQQPPCTYRLPSPASARPGGRSGGRRSTVCRSGWPWCWRRARRPSPHSWTRPRLSRRCCPSSSESAWSRIRRAASTGSWRSRMRSGSGAGQWRSGPSLLRLGGLICHPRGRAPPFDAALAVRAAHLDGPVAWFGVFAERRRWRPSAALHGQHPTERPG